MAGHTYNTLSQARAQTYTHTHRECTNPAHHHHRRRRRLQHRRGRRGAPHHRRTYLLIYIYYVKKHLTQNKVAILLIYTVKKKCRDVQ